MALHSVSGSLAASAPFSFSQTLGFIERFTPCAGEQHVEQGVLTKAVEIGGMTLGMEIGEAPGGVSYRLHSERPICDALRRAAEDRIAFFLSLGDDLPAFYARARGDAALERVVPRLHGMHHVKFVTPFENAIWAVLGQRTPIRLARRVKDALVAKLGTRISVNGVEHRAFPSAERLADASDTQLAEIIGNARKVRYVRAVTEAFLRVDEAFLRSAPFDEIERWLLDIDGIGEWSSHFVLFRGLGRADRMPLNEALEDAAQRAYGASLDRRRLEERAAHFGPWQGYWALYLRA